MSGGPFDGARFFVRTYTPLGERTKVDLEGDFPALRGMSEADELAIIDGFFTTLVDEDTATLRTWTPHKRNDTHPGMGGKLLARHGIEFAEAEILEVECAALIGEGEDGSRERSSPFRAGDC